MILDTTRLRGTYTVQCIDSESKRVKRTYRADNTVTNAGKNLIMRMLLDVSIFNTGLTYQALGSGTATVLSSDTTLETEEVRRAITIRQDTTGTTGVFITYFPSNSLLDDTNTLISVGEIGIFGHSTAGGDADTGVLFSRSLLTVTLNADEDLSVSYVLNIT